MTSWLGVAILLAFSLGLNLFMRLERKPQAKVPDELLRWTRVTDSELPEGHYLERRVVELEGRGFTGARLVEQRRIRHSSDDRIVEILQERAYRPR